MQSINCQENNELLSAYIDNELEAGLTINIAGHLESCAACQKEMNHLSSFSKLLKNAIKNEAAGSLADRAAAINSMVRSQIGSEIANRLESPARIPTKEIKSHDTNVVSLSGQSKVRIWVKRAVLTLAASLLIFFSSFFGLLYYSSHTGPLMVGAIHNHTLCTIIEPTWLLWYKGEEVKKLMARNKNMTIPQLENAGWKFNAAHPCKIYNTPLFHMIYLKGDKEISLYYGSSNVVDRLRESEGEVVPGKIYQLESDRFRVAAISTPESNLWMVVGSLSHSEMKEIVDNLPINASEKRANTISPDEVYAQNH